MNLKQGRIILDKINALYKSISLDEGKISSIERDLMMSYIRQLYEVFLDEDRENPLARSSASESRRSQPTPEPTPRKQTPKIIEIPDSEKETTSPKPESRPAAEVKKTEPTPELEKTPEPAQKTTRGELESLFQFQQAKELSEKLSERPVQDLSRAMAINDRLLYLNDLFNKDQDAFNEALKLLNAFGSMNEAKSLLINFAEQYDWANEEKIDTARGFIKLVKRKYI